MAAQKTLLQPTKIGGYEMCILAAEFVGGETNAPSRAFGYPMSFARTSEGLYVLSIPGGFNDLVTLHLQLACDTQADGDGWTVNYDRGSVTNTASTGVITVQIEISDETQAVNDLETDMDLSIIAVMSDSSLNVA